MQPMARIWAVLGGAALALVPMGASAAPTGTFRVSANGASREAALKDATQLIGQVCAASSFVVIADGIRQADGGGAFYGPVSARCTPAAEPARPVTLAKL